MKKHRGLKITLSIAAALLAVILAGAWSMFGTQLTAANTIQKLNDGLWSMEYRGGYGFDGFLSQGGAASDEEMAAYIASSLSHGFWNPDTSSVGSGYGCSTLAVKSPDGAALFGRNFDWAGCSTMVIHTVPEEGYESVSTCCLDFLGFGVDWVPDGGITDKFMALAAVYVPLDGMNEKGLCAADLIVKDGQVTHQDTERPDLTTTSALRLVLDRAATVDEALELLEQYDMNFSIGASHHFSIADAAGRHAVVEYIDGEMVVTEADVVTNHYLAGDAGLALEEAPDSRRQSHIRYETLSGLCLEAGGVMTADEVRSALAAVAQSRFPDTNGGELTCWSLVYDQRELTAAFYDTEDWEHPYSLKLREKQWLSAPAQGGSQNQK